MKCIICEGSVNFLDNYKFNLNSDKYYFGELKIYHCSNCDFAFSNPQPERKKLDDYFKNIYRSGARHHEISDNYDLEYLSDRNLSYFSYLSSFINFQNIKNIFDYGAGNGNLGYLIKKKFNHINLAAIELGGVNRSILEKRKFKIYSRFDQIDEKFDLIISTRAIQQLSDLKIFQSFKSISHDNTYVFLDIPNNEFKNKFFERPYDTPGLTFFTKKSFLSIEKKFNLDIKNISYSSYSIDQAYQYMRESQKKVKLNNKSIFWKIKKIIKKFIPSLFLKIKFISYQLRQRDKLIEEFMLNKTDSWMLKVLFKWKKNI